MTDEPSGTLYIGVTGNLAARIQQHREGRGSDFCREHGLTRLVYVEQHDTMVEAITREKALKKVEACVEAQPDREDEPRLGIPVGKDQHVTHPVAPAEAGAHVCRVSRDGADTWAGRVSKLSA